MPRIRTIKPEFFVDDEVAKLEPLDRLTFIGLWTQADKAGRLEDRPTRLQVVILPYDKGDFDARLSRLQVAGFVIRYEVEGHKYLQIRTFNRHQRPHHTEQESFIPPCNGCSTVTTPCDNPPVRKGKEGNGKEGKEKDVGGDLQTTQAPPPLLDSDLKTWLLASEYLKPLGDERYCTLWKTLEAAYDQYSWLYFEEEIKKADAWLASNPDRRPTQKGLQRFIRNWLERAVTYGRKYHAQA